MPCFNIYQNLVRSEQLSQLFQSSELPALSNKMHFPLGRRRCRIKGKEGSSDLLGRDASAEFLQEQKFFNVRF